MQSNPLEKARSGIREELEGHISDQCSAYISEGMSEAEANERAVKQMGDPVEVGVQLDRLHRPKRQPMLLILVFAIILSGLVLKILIPEFSSGENFFAKQTVSLLLGTAAMLSAYFFDYGIIVKHPKSLFWAFAAILACGLVLSGEQRLSLSAVFASLGLMLPIAFTGVIFATRNTGAFGIFICLAALSFQTMLCLMIPNGTCAMVVFLCGLILTSIAVSKNHFNASRLFSILLLGAFIISVTVALFYGCLNGRAAMRIKYAFYPQDYSNEWGWLSLTIREALANARLVGAGAAQEGLKELTTHQPSIVSSDLMLLYLIHRYGWISFILIVALFGLFFGKAMRACSKLKSVTGKYVCTAVLLVLMFQFVLYCTANLGFNLFSPLFLPLLSGSCATAVNLFLVGFMLSVFRNDCADKPVVCPPARESRFCMKDGKLIITFNP